MKTTLAALVLSQLVVLSESWRFEESQETHSKMVSQRFTIEDLQQKIKTCSRNPKLESMRKTLSLATLAEHGRQRQKRSSFGFPVSCLHFGIIEFSEGPSFHYPLFACCEQCHWPKFAACQSKGDPNIICASRAYKCICDCRKKHVDNTGAELIVRYRSGSSFHSIPLVKERNDICKKMICNRRGYGYKSCCLEEQCIKLKFPEEDIFYTKQKRKAKSKKATGKKWNI